MLIFDDPDTCSALRYIRDNALDGIEVEDVIRHVNVSRSSLERKLHAVGHTPGHEIRRVRIRHAVKLLVETELPLVGPVVTCSARNPWD